MDDYHKALKQAKLERENTIIEYNNKIEREKEAERLRLEEEEKKRLEEEALLNAKTKGGKKK